jgi:hypothetical protein
VSRFVPTPLGWTTHPLCVRLREENPAYPDRWSHFVARAHMENRGGSLLLYDDTPLDAKALSHDHDRDVQGWQSFLDFCQELGLAEVNGQTMAIPADVWKEWYRAPSQYPEVEKYRRSESRKAKELEEVNLELAIRAREIEELKKKLKAKPDPNQLKLELAEDRADRVPEKKAEHDADSLPAAPEGRADRVPSEPKLSQVNPSRPDNRSTCTNTCRSRDTTQTHVVSFDSNVVYLGEDNANAEFWRKAEKLCSRVSKRGWKQGKSRLEKALRADWANEYPDPESRWWALASAVQETVERMKEGQKINCPWGYALSILDKYAAFGSRVAWMKKQGESASFVRLREMEAV